MVPVCQSVCGKDSSPTMMQPQIAEVLAVELLVYAALLPAASMYPGHQGV